MLHCIMLHHVTAYCEELYFSFFISVCLYSFIYSSHIFLPLYFVPSVLLPFLRSFFSLPSLIHSSHTSSILFSFLRFSLSLFLHSFLCFFHIFLFYSFLLSPIFLILFTISFLSSLLFIFALFSVPFFCLLIFVDFKHSSSQHTRGPPCSPETPTHPCPRPRPYSNCRRMVLYRPSK